MLFKNIITFLCHPVFHRNDALLFTFLELLSHYMICADLTEQDAGQVLINHLDGWFMFYCYGLVKESVLHEINYCTLPQTDWNREHSLIVAETHSLINTLREMYVKKTAARLFLL